VPHRQLKNRSFPVAVALEGERGDSLATLSCLNGGAGGMLKCGASYLVRKTPEHQQQGFETARETERIRARERRAARPSIDIREAM
jgi:hypothetical protein